MRIGRSKTKPCVCGGGEDRILWPYYASPHCYPLFRIFDMQDDWTSYRKTIDFNYMSLTQKILFVKLGNYGMHKFSGV